MSRSPLAQTTRGRSNWRTATKRQILGNFAEQPEGASQDSSKIDGTNVHHVRLVIDGMQEKYDQILTFLKSDLDNHKLEQEECLSTGLIKLSKNIRNMKVKDFNSKYSCDLLALLKSKDGVVLSGSSRQSLPPSGKPPAVDATKKRCYETPAPRFRRPGQLNTVMRTARRGEGLL